MFILRIYVILKMMYLMFYHVELGLGRPQMHLEAYIHQILDTNYVE